MAWDLPQDTDNNASFPSAPQTAPLEYPKSIESPSAAGRMGNMMKDAVKSGANYISNDMLTPDYWKGMAAHAATVPMGAMQTIAHSIEGVFPPSPGPRSASQQIESGITKLNQPGNEQYEAGGKIGPYAAGAAATLAAPYMLPEALASLGGAGMTGAALRGALGGGALGAATPVTDNPSQDFAQKKFEQVLPAAAAGGVTSGLFGLFGPKAAGPDIATAESGASQNAPAGILSRIAQAIKSPWFKDWAIGLPMGETISQGLLGHPSFLTGSNLGAKAGLAAGSYGLMQLMRSRAGQALAPYLSSGAAQTAAQSMTDNPYAGF